METKFIEGSNEQYSIREDGAVFIHYRMQRITNTIKKKISFNKRKKLGKKGCVSLKIDNKITGRSVNKLLFSHFGYFYCKKCGNKAYHDTNNAVWCDDCREKSLIIRTNNAVKVYKKRYPDRVKENQRKWFTKSRDTIDKNYAASKLHIFVSELDENIYNLYRNCLLFKREVTKEHNINIEKFN